MKGDGTVSESGGTRRGEIGDDVTTTDVAGRTGLAVLTGTGDREVRLTADEVATIYEHETGRVRRYVAFRVRDPRDVDDLTADVFRRLVCGPVPASPGSWAAWLLRVAHNVVVDHYRRQRRFDPLALLFDRPDDAPPLDERLIRDEELSAVDRVLDRLPGRQRAAVYLRYREALGYEEIASVLGVPAVTARTLVHRGLRRVAAQLAKEETR
jgi:RNA polymerase sigma-70 factor, ECF subfamily